MQQPLHRFCDLVFGWLVADTDAAGREKVIRQLNDPLPGEARRDPTPEELDEDYQAMMALGQQLAKSQ